MNRNKQPGQLSATAAIVTTPADGVYRLHPPDGGEVYVVDSGAGLILIDSSFVRHQPVLDAALRAAELDPAAVRLGIATHGHCDHVGGMGQWRAQYGLKVLASAHAAGVMERADPIETAATIEPVGHRESFVPCPVDRRVGDGEVVTLGRRRLEIIAAPGHTPGGIHIRMDDLVFVGDNLFADGTIGWMDVHWGSNPEDYLETLRRLRRDVGRLALAGHGEPFDLNNDLIDLAASIVSFYLSPGHGLGYPRVPSRYRTGLRNDG